MDDDIDPYATLTEWYDQEHDSYLADVSAIDGLLRSRGLIRARVLEIGSGTGRLLAGLAAAGHEVVGVEPSASMRARCEMRMAALPPRVSKRMRQEPGSAVTLDKSLGEFDLALYGLGTLAHLLAESERVASLGAARKLLLAQGATLVDLDSGGLSELLATGDQRQLLADWTDALSGERVAHFARATTHPLGAIATITHEYVRTGQDGVALPTTVVPMRLAVIDKATLLAELESAGYGKVQLWGDHFGSPWRAESARLIAVAERGVI